MSPDAYSAVAFLVAALATFLMTPVAIAIAVRTLPSIRRLYELRQTRPAARFSPRVMRSAVGLLMERAERISTAL